MENKLDRLFAEKLKGHTTNPSPQAWEKLHSGLAARRRKVWFGRLAVAAAVALLFAVAFSVTRVREEQQTKAPVAQSMEKQPFSHESLPQEAMQGDQPEQAGMERFADQKPQGKSETAPIAPSANNTIEKSSETHEQPLVAMRVEKEKTPVFHGKKVIIVLGKKPQTEEGDQLMAGAADEDSKEVQNDDELLAQASSDQKQEMKADRIVIVYKKDRREEEKRRSPAKIIDNSLGKLAEFYDQKVMTDEVKADLNTLKKDVLAWRVDKLFSKKNN